MATKPVPNFPTRFHPHIRKNHLNSLVLEGTDFQDVKAAEIHFDGKTYKASKITAIAGHPLRIEFTPTHEPMDTDESALLDGSSDLTITLTYNGTLLDVPAAPVYYAN